MHIVERKVVSLSPASDKVFSGNFVLRISCDNVDNVKCLSWCVNIIVMWQIAIDGVYCTLTSEIQPFGWQLYFKE